MDHRSTAYAEMKAAARDRASKRRRASLVLVGCGLVLGLVPALTPISLLGPPALGMILGALLVLVGGLGLAGVNVFAGGPLDARLDAGGPAVPAELLRTDRLAEQPGRDPRERWLPLAFATFPPRCTGCGAQPTTSWHVAARRGIDLLVLSVHRMGSVAAPVCASCRRRRRIRGLLLRATPFVPLLALLLGPAGLGWVPVTEPVVIAGFAATALLAAAVRVFGPRLLDGRVLGVAGRRLDADGRAGLFHFRSEALAREVAELTKRRIEREGAA